MNKKRKPLSSHYYQMAHPREYGVYEKIGYIKNPTAANITQFIKVNYIGNKNTVENYTYVIDLNNNNIIGKRNAFGKDSNSLLTPHPTLIDGKDIHVKMAGILRIEGGKIAWYNNESAHFKPNNKSMIVADESYSKLGDQYFTKGFLKAHKKERKK